MRYYWKKLFLLLMAVAVLVPLLSAPVQANLAQYRAQRQALQRSIRETQRQLAANLRYLNEAEREIEALDYQIMYVLGNMVTLSDSIDDVEERLEAAVNELEAARVYHAAQEAIVRERLRDLHEHGQLNMLDVLVQSSSIRDFIMRMEFMTRVSRQDQNMLDRLEEAEQRYVASVANELSTRALLGYLMTDLTRTAANLEQLMEQWEARQYELLENRQTFEEMLAAYEAQERTVAQQEAAEVRRLEIERERERQRMEAIARAQLNGPLTWPVPGFFGVSSPFGMRANPFNRRVQQMHHGIDIAGPGINGANVVAALDGFVSMATPGWNGGFGTVIMIDHGNGMTTVYAHLSRMQVTVGQRVHAGQVIGNVGSTGNSTGPHLHFEVRHGTRRVDPMPYLRG